MTEHLQTGTEGSVVPANFTLASGAASGTPSVTGERGPGLEKAAVNVMV